MKLSFGTTIKVEFQNFPMSLCQPIVFQLPVLVFDHGHSQGLNFINDFVTVQIRLGNHTQRSNMYQNLKERGENMSFLPSNILFKVFIDELHVNLIIIPMIL